MRERIDRSFKEPTDVEDAKKRLFAVEEELGNFESSLQRQREAVERGVISKEQHEEWARRFVIAKGIHKREQRLLQSWLRIFCGVDPAAPSARQLDRLKDLEAENKTIREKLKALSLTCKELEAHVPELATGDTTDREKQLRYARKAKKQFGHEVLFVLEKALNEADDEWIVLMEKRLSEAVNAEHYQSWKDRRSKKLMKELRKGRSMAWVFDLKGNEETGEQAEEQASAGPED